jgi:hypothetical protein
MPDSPTITVPNVVNLPQTAAENMLKNAGLVVGTITTVNGATTPAGTVSGANPAPGTPVSANSEVNLEISSGIEAPSAPTVTQPGVQVSVPDVVGLTRPAAEAVLKSAGFTVGAVKTHHSDSVPDGGISNIYPDAGALLKQGSSVDLDLSRGPEPNWTQYIPIGLFALLGFVVLGLIVYGITEKDQEFLTSLSKKEVARGLITFLIAITTVGIAMILAISTLVLAPGDDGDKRFDRGKQILSVLIGVLGTIVGFYFGSETSTKPVTPTEQTETSSQKITTPTLPDGVANKAYQSTLQATGLTGKLKWSVKPDLPADLGLDSTTGTISGTPKAAMLKATFTFTVTDSAAPPVTFTKDLTLEIK